MPAFIRQTGQVLAKTREELLSRVLLEEGRTEEKHGSEPSTLAPCVHLAYCYEVRSHEQ